MPTIRPSRSYAYARSRKGVPSRENASIRRGRPTSSSVSVSVVPFPNVTMRPSLRRYTRPPLARTVSVPSAARSNSSHSSEPGGRTPAQRPSSSHAYSTRSELGACLTAHPLDAARDRRHHRLERVEYGLEHVGGLPADALELREQLVGDRAEV